MVVIKKKKIVEVDEYSVINMITAFFFGIVLVIMAGVLILIFYPCTFDGGLSSLTLLTLPITRTNVCLTQPEIILDPHTLGFSIYSNTSLLVGAYKTLYANANASDLLIDDEYNTPVRAYLDTFNKPQEFPRFILANNYSELTSSSSSLYINDVSLAKRYNFTSTDYMAYDPEDWSLTPQSEQDNYAHYANLSCEYVHSAGYKFGITPEIDVPGWAPHQFANLNWTCVNLLDLQEQFNSRSPSALVSNVTALSVFVLNKNPNIKIFVQLDMAGDNNNATQSEIETDVTDLSQIQGISGVIFQDTCSKTGCPVELGTVVNYTKELEAEPTTSTISTTIGSSTNVTSLSTTSTSSTSTTTSVSTTIPIGIAISNCSVEGSTLTCNIVVT